MGQSSITSFYACPASDTEVELIIGGLIVYPAFQSPFRLLYSKRYARLISGVVSKLISASIAEGQFPEILKVTAVIPIFIPELREIITNYRSILTLRVLSKIFEKLRVIT